MQPVQHHSIPVQSALNKTIFSPVYLNIKGNCPPFPFVFFGSSLTK